MRAAAARIRSSYRDDDVQLRTACAARCVVEVARGVRVLHHSFTSRAAGSDFDSNAACRCRTRSLRARSSRSWAVCRRHRSRPPGRQWRVRYRRGSPGRSKVFRPRSTIWSATSRQPRAAGCTWPRVCVVARQMADAYAPTMADTPAWVHLSTSAPPRRDCASPNTVDNGAPPKDLMPPA